MNMKKILILSAVASLVANNISIISANIDAVKKSERKLKYRKDLSMESKDCIKQLNKEISLNFLRGNVITFAIDIIPAINLLSIPYIYNRKDGFSSNVEEMARDTFNKINIIENEIRENNGNLYKELIETYNLEPLIEISEEELELSYKELKKLIKKHNLIEEEISTLSYVMKR